MSSATPQAGSVPPPVLRQDLSLYDAEPEDGVPVWVLHDPVANRYFRMHQQDVEMLPYIDGRAADDVAEALYRELSGEADLAAVEEMFTFLRRHNLVQVDGYQNSWFRQQQAQKTSMLAWLARSYLFIRIPLVRPDRFLDRSLPWVEWLGAAWVQWLLGICALLSLVLTVQRWDSFWASFVHFFTIQGVVSYLAVLAGVKVLHELGHAYVAKAHGCHVPVMGVAFLVGWPVLYTDSTDAWRLSSRRKRMLITAAGVRVELALAVVSLLMWHVTADGVLRSVLFMTATTTWAMSLLVNLNPLMRFDGYHFFVDMIRFPNLESRSFQLARWRIREAIFGFGIAPPEHYRSGIALFAVAVWCYRFLLYLGIATLVYAFFFKAAGILLYLLEITYFILLPVWNEMKRWYELRGSMRWNRNTRISLSAVLLLIGLFFYPWRVLVEAPAVLEARSTQVYATVSGQLDDLPVAAGVKVSAGDALFQIQALPLQHEWNQAQLKYRELSGQRASMGFDADMLERALVINTELQSQLRRIKGLENKLAKQVITAPHQGIVTDLTPGLTSGDWIAEGEPLLRVVDYHSSLLTAYVDESDLARLSVGASAMFYSESGQLAVLPASLKEIEPVGIQALESLYPASLFGGALAVRENERHELIPVSGTYRVRLALDSIPAPPAQVIRGTVVIRAESRSLYDQLCDSLGAFFRRESGF